MSYICPYCKNDNESHSLELIYQIKNILVFYTIPSKAKLYDDVESTIEHYKGVWKNVSKNYKWIWIIDSIDFGFKHYLNFNVGLELLKLIYDNFSENILKIIIINHNFFTGLTYNIIYPLLSEKIKEIVFFDYEFTDKIDFQNNTIIKKYNL